MLSKFLAAVGDTAFINPDQPYAPPFVSTMRGTGTHAHKHTLKHAPLLPPTPSTHKTGTHTINTQTCMHTHA